MKRKYWILLIVVLLVLFIWAELGVGLVGSPWAGD